ncbi:MAG: NTP transferase domain-containing protein [Gammaproteobacteria bacterium]
MNDARRDISNWVTGAAEGHEHPRLPAIVLAGERPGGNALARAHGLRSSVLVPVAGTPCVTRVLHALRASRSIEGGLLVGPDGDTVAREPVFQELLATGDFRWIAPDAGPSASALRASAALHHYPVLLTAADHALLDAGIIDRFVAAALASRADFVVGLVPWATVRARFPTTRRTLLRFADGAWCGANLFLLHTHAGRAALEFWRGLEADRKRPWRMASRIGFSFLARYLARSMRLTAALAHLSARAGCEVAHVRLDSARAAVDVDSSADLALAEEVLQHG